LYNIQSSVGFEREMKKGLSIMSEKIGHTGDFTHKTLYLAY